jgi:hypothetical protein
MTDEEIAIWTAKQNRANPTVFDLYRVMKAHIKPVPEMTDLEFARWTKEQDEKTLDEKSYLKTANDKSGINWTSTRKATIFNTLDDIEFFRHQNENLTVNIISGPDISAAIEEWIDGIEERPLVLSFATFNSWAQLTRDLYFTKDDALAAYESVVSQRFVEKFECNRVISAGEFAAFFEQYGGIGLVAGTIDREGSKAIEACTEYQKRVELIAKLKVTYYFSEPAEAMFARVALV